MQHVDIEAVEAKAKEFEEFAKSCNMDSATAADYAQRSKDLFEFAKELRRWRGFR